MRQLKKINMLRKLLFVYILIGISITNAQETFGPKTISTGRYLGETIPLRNAAIYNPDDAGINVLKIIPNGYEGSHENLVEGRSKSKNVQRNFGALRTVGVDQNFDGSSVSESGGAVPPDPTGAAGPNHYVHAVNSIIKVFDKEGNLLSGPTALGSFLGNGTNAGDPIVMYDQLADRWFVSQFGTAANSLVLGVSTTNDPTGTYNVYEYVFGAFPDYPHYSIWPDGYYLSINEGGGGANNNRSVYTLDRDAILAGEANPQILSFQLPGLISNPTTIFNSGPAHITGIHFPENTPGFISYLQDDSWSNAITQDHLKVWEIDLDWDNVNNSTISTPQEIALDNFDSVFAQFGVGEIDQPGTNQELAAQGGIISYASNYRSFENHNSWLITFNVDIDGNDTSGIRWIELRNTAANNEWTLFQEGTYAPDDGNSRFMSSGGIDNGGNIAIAYSVGGANTPVGLRYTGRFDGDAPGEMTLGETIIVDGVGVQTFANRYGDYAHLTMDPDNFTFWYTSQYYQQTNVWTSRIASFRLSDEFNDDVGVVAINAPNDGILTNAENVEVSIRNFGTSAQTNVPLELFLDNVLAAEETFTGTINPGEIATYTFITPIDLSTAGQTYVLRVGTNLTSDEFTVNDEFQKEVLHTFSNDIGVVAITSPSQVTSIGDQTISAIVRNFGAITQSDFDIQYTVNGGTPVIEQITGITLDLGEEFEYSFNTQANIDVTGTYTIEVGTNLANDENNANDATSIVAEVLSCLPTATGGNGGSGCLVDGIKRFVLGDINVDDGQDGCNTEPEGSPNGYANRTNLSTVLSNVEGSNVHNLRAQTNWDDGVGVEVLSAWIDFNDNSIFEPSEQLIAGVPFSVVDALDNFELVIPVGSTLGSHILRVKAIDGSATGDINDPCSDYDFGETQDYTVIIDEILNTNEIELSNFDLEVSTTDHKNFDFVLTTQLDGRVNVAIYNSLGQQLKYKNLRREGDTFNLSLDMEAVASGLYFVKMIAVDHNVFKTTKILVK